MKIAINIDFDTNSPCDLDTLKKVIDIISMRNESMPYSLGEKAYEEAWTRCSWEIVVFALTILRIHDGITDKGVFAFFDSLCDPQKTQLCGELTERSISSRVGRTAVICKPLGDFRLMEVAVRKKDKIRRVYIDPTAREVLINMLKGDWGNEFNKYLVEQGHEAQNFSDL